MLEQPTITARRGRTDIWHRDLLCAIVSRTGGQHCVERTTSINGQGDVSLEQLTGGAVVLATSQATVSVPPAVHVTFVFGWVTRNGPALVTEVTVVLLWYHAATIAAVVTRSKTIGHCAISHGEGLAKGEGVAGGCRSA